MNGGKKITRRTFLKSAAVGIALPYFVPSSVLGLNGRTSANNKIVMGFIGVGSQGMGNMIGGDNSPIPGGFIGKSEVKVAAVCDTFKNRRERARDIVNEKYGNKDCKAYGDFRELLAREDIDAVMVATPDHWHALIGITAAKAGKDVYGEKPLAYNVSEGRAICNAVKKYGTVWQTGSQQRSGAQFRLACELVRNKRIGELKQVSVSLPQGVDYNLTTDPVPVPDGLDYDMWLGPAPWEPYCEGRCGQTFRNISDYSSGPVADWAGHHCDIAQWGLGADDTGPVEVEGKGSFLSGGLFDSMMTYHFECLYANGVKMIVEDYTKRAAGKDGIKFTPGYGGLNIGILFEGTEGWVQVNRGGMDVYPKSILNNPIRPNEIHLYKSEDHKQNFLDCIRSRSQTVAPPEVAQRAISIGYLGIAAMKLGRKLKWNPEKEQFINDDVANRMLYREMRSPWRI